MWKLIIKLKDWALKTSTSAAKDVLKGVVLKVSIAIVLIIVVISLIFSSLNYVSGRYACYVKWEESGIESKYTLRGGCLLKRGEGWLPAANFRVE